MNHLVCGKTRCEGLAGNFFEMGVFETRTFRGVRGADALSFRSSTEMTLGGKATDPSRDYQNFWKFMGLPGSSGSKVHRGYGGIYQCNNGFTLATRSEYR